MEEWEAQQLADTLNETLASDEQRAYIHRTPAGWEVHVYWISDCDQRFRDAASIRDYLTELGR